MMGPTDDEMLAGPSPFLKLFGDAGVGRPRNDSVGLPTGDPRITSLARRRATRVLRLLHKEEFEELMQREADYIKSIPKG